MKKVFTIAAIALAIPFAAQAQGGYIGANVGRVKQNTTDQLHFSDIKDTKGVSAKGSDTGYKLYGGYDFSEHFGMEGGYITQQKFDAEAPAGTAPKDGRAAVRGAQKSLYLAATATMPMAESLALFGKAGLAYNRTSFDVIDQPSRSHDQLSPMLGVGVSYALADNTSVVAEYESYGKLGKLGKSPDQINAKASMLSVGLRYKF